LFDIDRCRCDGAWVDFDWDSAQTHGCEVAGPPQAVRLEQWARVVARREDGARGAVEERVYGAEVRRWRMKPAN
jgi:hypothetical protein